MDLIKSRNESPGDCARSTGRHLRDACAAAPPLGEASGDLDNWYMPRDALRHKTVRRRRGYSVAAQCGSLGTCNAKPWLRYRQGPSSFATAVTCFWLCQINFGFPRQNVHAVLASPSIYLGSDVKVGRRWAALAQARPAGARRCVNIGGEVTPARVIARSDSAMHTRRCAASELPESDRDTGRGIVSRRRGGEAERSTGRADPRLSQLPTTQLFGPGTAPL